MSRSFYVWASFHFWEISPSQPLCLCAWLHLPYVLRQPWFLQLHLSFTDNIANASLVFLSLSSSKTNSLSQEAIFIKCHLGLYVREKEAAYLFAMLFPMCVHTHVWMKDVPSHSCRHTPTHVPVDHLTETHWVTQNDTTAKGHDMGRGRPAEVEGRHEKLGDFWMRYLMHMYKNVRTKSPYYA